MLVNTIENRALIKKISPHVVAKVAPEELPLFDELIEEYFDDPNPPDLSVSVSDEPLGMSWGELLIAVTPAVAAAVNAVLRFISTQVLAPRQANGAGIVQSMKSLFNKRNVYSDHYSRYETGLNQLLNRLDRDHPRYFEALVYRQRLLENISRTWRFGDTHMRRAERAEIMDQLNELVLSVLGISFNELCNLPPYITRQELKDNKRFSQQIQQRIKEIASQQAQAFGMSVDEADQIANELVKLLILEYQMI